MNLSAVFISECCLDTQNCNTRHRELFLNLCAFYVFLTRALKKSTSLCVHGIGFVTTMIHMHYLTLG